MTTDRDVSAWLDRHLPQDWFTGPPHVVHDAEEVLVVGRLPDAPSRRGMTDAELRALRIDRAETFREESRPQRTRLAQHLEAALGRRLSWGVDCGEVRVLFSGVGVPVMTRLRMPERRVLDTLVGGGVARSRSEALSWCVRLVAANPAWTEEAISGAAPRGQTGRTTRRARRG